jgi:hypothetical protein
LRRRQRNRRGNVDVIGQDIYFRKPELDGNSGGGWGGGEGTKGMEPRSELPT